MRLTTMTDYALRLLMYAGTHRDRLCTIAEIADAHGISEAHLMKVTHQLGLHGWIETLRGKGGGLRLAHAPEAISIGKVVRDMEPDFVVVDCFSADGGNCRLSGSCRLTAVLRDAVQGFLAPLDATSLADLLADSGAAATPYLMRRARA